MYDELTAVDIAKMEEEIRYRQDVLGPELLAEMSRTRAFGDLSENAEYKEAKREKRRNEGASDTSTSVVGMGRHVGDLQLVKHPEKADIARHGAVHGRRKTAVRRVKKHSEGRLRPGGGKGEGFDLCHGGKMARGKGFDGHCPSSVGNISRMPSVMAARQAR